MLCHKAFLFVSDFLKISTRLFLQLFCCCFEFFAVVLGIEQVVIDQISSALLFPNALLIAVEGVIFLIAFYICKLHQQSIAA
ncbi:hypothetical protein D3C85_1603590 [compost metagenome]